jgi:hypothetical protein
MVAKISNDPAIVSYHPGLQAEMLCSFYHFRMVLDYLFLLFQKRIHASSTIEIIMAFLIHVCITCRLLFFRN